jgi:hypothetical protein
MIRVEPGIIKWLIWRLAFTAAGLVFTTGVLLGVAYADSLQSPNYRFDESSLGNGGFIQSQSNNFQANGSAGDTAVGNTASGNFQIDTGSQTTADPALSFAVNTGNANFGSFSPSTATVTTSTFQVSNYTTYGYVVQVLGNPPKDVSGHTITAMASTGTSQAGTEQFGINLVANTSPTSVGSNPVNSIFGVGTAAANYDTANNYRYVSGETIASAPKNSGLTTYTITYLVNVNPLTPGGQYSGNQTLICTGTY